MHHFFNSRGRHIAIQIGSRLFLPAGENVGHFIDDLGIFVDLQGQYLGEIVDDDRLMAKTASPCKSTNYGPRAACADNHPLESPGDRASLGLVLGCEDVRFAPHCVRADRQGNE